MKPVDVVQAQLEAYNAQDIETFCACFAQDCVIADLNGALPPEDLGQLRERCQAMFARYPRNKARIASRMALGNVVIDHEVIQRSPELRVEAIAIYTVRDGLISRVDFVRAS
jgi:hypothetical protein